MGITAAGVVPPGYVSWITSSGGFECFMPTGRAVRVGPRRNPSEPLRSSLKARIIVGLNVGSKPRWTVEDVMALYRKLRTKKGRDQSGSFIFQRGLYQKNRRTRVVEEHSVQILVYNDEAPRSGKAGGNSVGRFKRETKGLCECLASALKQDQVTLEIEDRNNWYGTWRVTPRRQGARGD